MSTSQEAPALIQYACERCKTRFVLPPSSRKLSIAGKVHAFSMGVGRTFRNHEALGSGYDTARRQLLAKMDDEAYQSFVQSFRFCHECRQFVCNECWSTSRRSCLTCVAKAMTGTVRPRPPFAPTGPEIPRPIVSTAPPRRGRLRRDVALIALALGIALASIEGGVLLVSATGGPNPTPERTTIVQTPSPSPTAVPSPTETATASPSESPSESPSPSPSASPSATATPGSNPVPTPVKTAAPTATRPPATPTPIPAMPKPAISCTVTSYSAGTSGTVTCTITNWGQFLAGDQTHWDLNGATIGDGGTSYAYIIPDDGNTYTVDVVVDRASTGQSIMSDVHAGGANSGW